MPITLPQSTLSPILSAIASMAKPSGTIEATQYAFLSHSAGALTIRATDGINWLTLSAPCEGDLQDIQIDAAKLNEVVGKMRAADIRLTTKDGKLKLDGKGGGSRTLPGVLIPFPQRDSVAGASLALPVTKLHEALAFVRESASDDQYNKAHLCGVHIHSVEGRYKMAAAYAAGASMIDLGKVSGEDVSVTIASPTVAHLGKVTGDSVTMTISDRAVQFDWDGGTLIGSRTTLDFVDYAKSMAAYDTYLSIRAPELLSAMSSIAPVAQREIQSSSQIVKLVLAKDGVTLEATSGVEPLDAEWHGPDMTVGFISKRMKAALDGFGDDELRVEISDPGKPIVVRSTVRDDRVSVLMGVRL